MSWWNSRGGIKGLLLNTCACIVFTLAFIKYTNKSNLDVYVVVLIHEFCLSAAPATTHTCFFLIWRRKTSVDVWRKTGNVSLAKARESASFHRCPSGRTAAHCRATLPRVGWCNWKTNTYNAQLAAILCKSSTRDWPLNLVSSVLNCNKSWPVKKACH